LNSPTVIEIQRKGQKQIQKSQYSRGMIQYQCIAVQATNSQAVDADGQQEEKPKSMLVIPLREHGVSSLSARTKAFTRTRIQYTSSLGSSDRLRDVAYQNLFTNSKSFEQDLTFC
jgi:hypothetical protein